jgi:hypothetical protein
MKTAIVALLLASAAVAQSPIDVPKATQVFTELHGLCAADNGQLWGHTLCVPMLFVDPATRSYVGDIGGSAPHDLRIDKLPASVPVANTAVEVEGAVWSEILWPLPDDAEPRHVLMLHESFHAVQKDLEIQPISEPHNDHLDTLQGRYWIRLEFRALAAALHSSGPAREQAIRDALAFRARRAELFPLGAKEEFALESNEGLAEYTGVKAGITDPARQIAYALKDLADGEAKPSFVRSFAYATGPAYGLLLDQANVRWRPSALKLIPAVSLLAESLPKTDMPSPETAAKRYGGEDIWKEESAREAENNKKKADYRARLVTGPVITLPLQKMNIQFNPNRLFPLDDLGTVYPTLRISDNWGVFEVTTGIALVSKNWDSVTFPAPVAAVSAVIEGPGWTLHLNDGYNLVPGPRKGDWTLGKSPAK